MNSRSTPMRAVGVPQSNNTTTGSTHNSRTSATVPPRTRKISTAPANKKLGSYDYPSGTVLTGPSTSTKTGHTSKLRLLTELSTTTQIFGSYSPGTGPSTSKVSQSTGPKSYLSNKSYTVLPSAPVVDMGKSNSKSKRPKITEQGEPAAHGLKRQTSLPARSKKKPQAADTRRYSGDVELHQASSSTAASPMSGDWTNRQDRSILSEPFASLPSSGRQRGTRSGQDYNGKAGSQSLHEDVHDYGQSSSVKPSEDYNDVGMGLNLQGPEVGKAERDRNTSVSSHRKPSGPMSMRTQRNQGNKANSSASRHKSRSGSASMNYKNPQPATDMITVAPHVWRYITEYHKADLERIMKLCSLIVHTKRGMTVELQAESQRDLDIALNEVCIPLIQRVTSEVHFDKYHVTGFEDPKTAASYLKSQFNCVMDKDTSNRHTHRTLSVTSLKTDVEAIKRLLKDGPQLSKPSISSAAARNLGQTSPVVNNYPALSQEQASPVVNKSARSRRFESAGYYIGNVMVLVHRCDITTLAVDVIVNSANHNLHLAGALAGAMAQAGGPGVQDECTQIVRQRGKLNLSDVVPTGAGRMPAKKIYHTYGPAWPENDLSGQKKCIGALRETVYNVLELAAQMSVRSIAIPPLSSGVYGVPGQYVADVFAECVQHIQSPVTEVHLVDLSMEFLSLIRDRLDSLVGTGHAGTALAKSKVQELVRVASTHLTGATVATQDEFAANAHTMNNMSERGYSDPPEKYMMSLPPTGTPSVKASNDTMYVAFQAKGFIVDNKVQVFIHNCDITKLKVDAIVNAANIELKHCGGLSKVIANAAGRDLVEDCKKITRDKDLMVSQVVRTRPGNLSCQCVYHAAGPRWPAKDERRLGYHLMADSQTECLKVLERTFWNIFETAVKDRMESIACPAVSSGVYRVPLDEVAGCMSRAIMQITHHYPNGKLREIHLVDVTNATLQAIFEAFDGLERRGQVKTLPDSRVTQVLDSRSGRSSIGAEGPLALHDNQVATSQNHHPSRSTFGDTYSPTGFVYQGKNIFVHQCDITSLKVEGIVNAANDKLNHIGGLAKNIADAAGPQLVAECKKIMDTYKSLFDGDVVRTSGGRLHAKYVLHAVGPRWPRTGRNDDQKMCIKLLNMTFEKVMQRCRQLDLKSVAIPAISSGIYGVPEDKVAAAMCRQILSCVDKCPQLNDIHLVDYSKNMLALIEARLQEQQLKQLDAKHVKDLIDNVVDSSKPSYVPTSTTKAGRMAWRGVGDDDYHNSTPSTSYSDTRSSGAERSRPQRSSTHSSSSREVSSSNRESSQRDVRPKEKTSTILKEVVDSEVDDAKTKPKSTDDEVCVICMCEITDPKTLDKCKHTFCRACIDHMFNGYQPKCPSCGVMYGVEKGTQPAGNMSFQSSSSQLPGHSGCGSYIITYSFSSGIQDAHHPNPGQPYSGTHRTAYLPDTSEGRTVLKLLRKAFNAKLLFTIGRSVTTGSENTVTWNDVHHKTSMSGGPTAYGYPDPTYLKRVKEELAAKGITE